MRTFFVYCICLPFFLCYAHLGSASPIVSDQIIQYIANSWQDLKRSMSDCGAFYDPKIQTNSIVYLPHDLVEPESLTNLEKRCSLTIKHLPQVIHHLGDGNLDQLNPSGLLYLPYPYVVPGGMFNEMYGWDSYFIIRGLLLHQNNRLAHAMIENFFFEIDHYGGTLNGNRTYYLSRSQLPFLALMVRALYEADTAVNQENITWLKKAYTYVIKDYELWIKQPHLAGKTGLSRYYDFGSGPVTELSGPTHTYFLEVIQHLIEHPDIGSRFLLHHQNTPVSHVGPLYNLTVCSPKQPNICKITDRITLREEFYQADRAMRESGFDISYRYGPFNADVLNYAPVDLNSLLYKTEMDLAWMSHQLGLKADESRWRKRAAIRRKQIHRFLWNEKKGFYYDYDFKHKQLSDREYASGFYPLWAGIATKSQANQIRQHLKHFEKPGGIVTSLKTSGAQWDYPYGWAPLQLITVEGLYQYGFNEDAKRVSEKFLSMVMQNFEREMTIREKYDVITRSSHTNIKVGYKTNVIGFGWTNGVFLTLFHQLNHSLAAPNQSEYIQLVNSDNK